MERAKKKKKISLNAIGLVVLAVLVAANFYVYKARAAGNTEAAALKTEISQVMQQSAMLPEPAQDLDGQLQEAKTALSGAQDGFDTPVELNEVFSFMLKTAGESGVQVLPLTSDDWKTVNLGQRYYVLNIIADAEGRLKNMETFLDGLQDGPYLAFSIADCSIKNPVPAIGQPAGEIYVTVKLKIEIYTRLQDTPEVAAP